MGGGDDGGVGFAIGLGGKDEACGAEDSDNQEDEPVIYGRDIQKCEGWNGYKYKIGDRWVKREGKNGFIIPQWFC